MTPDNKIGSGDEEDVPTPEEFRTLVHIVRDNPDFEEARNLLKESIRHIPRIFSGEAEQKNDNSRE